VAKGGRIQTTIAVFGKEVRCEGEILAQKCEIVIWKFLAWKYSVMREIQLEWLSEQLRPLDLLFCDRMEILRGVFPCASQLSFKSTYNQMAYMAHDICPS
jgi:hypothetical protein